MPPPFNRLPSDILAVEIESLFLDLCKIPPSQFMDVRGTNSHLRPGYQGLYPHLSLGGAGVQSHKSRVLCFRGGTGNMTAPRWVTTLLQTGTSSKPTDQPP